ncbi:MAG: hypothetical protein Q9181_005479 [Wetmoreana brouardii]
MAAHLGKFCLIFVLGPPGAGKSYLCQRAAEEMPDVQHVVMSDLLRAEAADPGSPWAREINEKLPNGILVSSELCVDVFSTWRSAQRRSCPRFCLLDGFPRNVDQAREFQEKMGLAQATISLTCSPKTLEERRAKRSRPDDDQKIAEARYQGYLDQTVPAIEHLRQTLDYMKEVTSDKDGDEGWELFKSALEMK